MPIPDPRVRTEWGGDDGDGEGWGSPHGQKGEEEEESGTRWKPWSVPWPTFFAPIDSNPRTLDSNPRNKRKSGGPGPTDDESAPETEDARGGSPSTSARGKARTVGRRRGCRERVLSSSSSSGEVYAGKVRKSRDGRPSVQGLTRSKSTSQNREERVAARDSRRDRINALTASPDVRNGASALLRQLWESMLSARAECERVAEALRGVPAAPARRNPGESARVDWISPPPLPRLFRSPAEVRERRETTHPAARRRRERVHAESDRKIGTRERGEPKLLPKLRARRPFGVAVDEIDWPQPPPFRPSHLNPEPPPPTRGPAEVRRVGRGAPGSSLQKERLKTVEDTNRLGGRFVFSCCAVAELTDGERDAIAAAVDPNEVDSLRRAMFPDDDDTVNDDESVNDDQTRRTPPPFEVACLRGLDDAQLLAAAVIRPAPGEGILGRYVEMPFIVTLPHARGRGLWRELTRELIGWTVRRADWRATALIVKVKRGGGGVKGKRDKKRGDRHWQETMWRDGAGAVRVDGGWGGARRRTSNARERIEAILERLGSDTGRQGRGWGRDSRRRPGSDASLEAGVVTSKVTAAGSLHHVPDRDLLLIRMLPPPDEGSGAAPSPLAPSISSRRPSGAVLR